MAHEKETAFPKHISCCIFYNLLAPNNWLSTNAQSLTFPEADYTLDDSFWIEESPAGKSLLSRLFFIAASSVGNF